MKDLCFAAYVYGWYQDFIPTYIYSILKAWPQHHVRIFVQEPLTENTLKGIDLIRSEVNSFDIRADFHDLDWCRVPHLAGLRFLLTADYFQEFKYVYFDDVDFVRFNEYNDQFFDRYLAHCRQTGLPFSNSWNYYKGVFRMTGLHFVVKEPYYAVMNRHILQTRKPRGNEFRRECSVNPSYPSYDEEMLYYMTAHAFDLRLLVGYERPLHGFHFGEFRPDDYAFTSYFWNRLKEYENNDKVDAILRGTMFEKLRGLMGPEAQLVVGRAMDALYRKLL